jgi:hypothetical protein
MRKIITCTAVAIALLSFACGSLVNPQLPISQEPLNLVEVGTGSRIQDVLIVPMYAVSVGISTGGGHGPGWMSYEESQEAPFVYRHGEPFRLSRPRSFGFLFGAGLLFVGRGSTLKSVVAVSRNHRALWVWSLWDRSLGAQFEMKQLAEPLAYRKWLLALLDGDVIRGNGLTMEDQDSFSLIPERNIRVKFSTEDRKVVRDFLTSGS